MRKHIISASAFLLLAACQQEEAFRPVEAKTGYIAEIENFGVQTKTSLNENNFIEWSENDRIAVFQGSTVADLFEVSAASVGKTTGSFKEVTSEGGGGFESGNEIPDNVAIYPYMEDLECASGMFSDEDAYVYKIENVYYPRIQVYQANSFPDDAFVMVAVTSGVKDNKLGFRNASGALRLRIKGDATVKSISIEGNADEPLGGYAVLKAYRDGSAPELESFGTSYGTVTLDCGNGVRLDEDTATEFIIALPPTDFENGFTVTINPKDGDPDVRKTEKRNSVRRSRVLNMPEITFGVPDGPSAGDAIDLNSDGQTANSYIISEAGTYRFAAVKGNSSEPVGAVAEAVVLWETFNTTETPVEGDLIEAVDVDEDGGILFSTPEDFREGNAVIAAKNSSGTILWSWHIWLTDDPEEQVYYNNAGIMMDRNLGAVSATPGDAGALGLLYQWGRKDPFLGAASIDEDIEAESTGSWPGYVTTSSSRGTISYTVSNPMTFVDGEDDWLYNGNDSDPEERWAAKKTIYDPCPAGWRVPDGGFTGVWIRSGFDAGDFDDVNKGISFEIESPATTWYPASAYKWRNQLYDVGDDGSYWAYNAYDEASHTLFFDDDGVLMPYSFFSRNYAQAVRCFKENSESPLPPVNEIESLHSDGETANSYIVSNSGTYKFKAVKGNSSEKLESPMVAAVLWESFGTDEIPDKHDLIDFVYYKDGMVVFSTADEFREGNAVIALAGEDDILWSWHIWFTDEPREQVYANGVGTMMDRNLGATSATPGDVGALGLLYQWGRKDPFLGSSSISSPAAAAAVPGEWPEGTESTAETGTIEYTIKYPYEFITLNEYNKDWYYTGDSTTDETRWGSNKTIYDPCPAGWRVPDGDFWSITFKSGSHYGYDSSNYGYFCGENSEIWYPLTGYRSAYDGFYYATGSVAYMWSAGSTALYWDNEGDVQPERSGYRAYANAVRCFKVGSSVYVPVTGLDLDTYYAELEVGQTKTLIATVYPSDASDKSLTWISSNPSVASVTDGVVKALSPGNARITVIAGDFEKYCEIKVISGFKDDEDDKLEDDGDMDWD